MGSQFATMHINPRLSQKGSCGCIDPVLTSKSAPPQSPIEKNVTVALATVATASTIDKDTFTCLHPILKLVGRRERLFKSTLRTCNACMHVESPNLFCSVQNCTCSIVVWWWHVHEWTGGNPSRRAARTGHSQYHPSSGYHRFILLVHKTDSHRSHNNTVNNGPFKVLLHAAQAHIDFDAH